MSAANLSNTTDLNKVHYMKEALPIIEYNLVYGQFGREDEMPRGDGNSFRFIRFDKPNSDENDGYTANTSGDSPTWTPDTPGDTLINVTPDFLFGDGYEWNSAREYTSWTDLPKALRHNINVQAAEALDKRYRDILKAGSNVVIANGKASRDLLVAADIIDMDDIFRCVENLKVSGAKPVAKFGKFACVLSPYAERSLLTDTAFRDLVEHRRPEDEFAGKIGTLAGVDFWVSQLAPTVSNGGSASSVATIDQTLIFGEGAYGVAKIMFDNFDVIYTPPGNGKGQGAHGDEWANKHKLTWKAATKAVILQDLYMVRLESARAS